MTTADQSYSQHRDKIDALIIQLQAAMVRMDEDRRRETQRNRSTWAYCGDAAHIEEQLRDVVAFVCDDGDR